MADPSRVDLRNKLTVVHALFWLGCFSNDSTSMLGTECFIRFGSFHEGLPTAKGCDLWFRLLNDKRIVLIRRPSANTDIVLIISKVG